MTNGSITADLEQRLSANPSSPLFALLAERLLKHGEISRAEQLCETGLAFHPSYTTGRLIRARCFAARGCYAEALGALGPVAAHYPGNILLAELGDEWRSLLPAESTAAPADDAVFVDLPASVMEPAPSGTVEADREVTEDALPVVTMTGTDAPDAAVSGAAPETAAPDAAVSEAVIPETAAPEATMSEAVIPETPAPEAVTSEADAFSADMAEDAALETAAPEASAVESAAPPLTPEITVPAREETPPGPVPAFQENDEGSAQPPMPVPSRHAGPVPLLQPVPHLQPLRRTVKGVGFIASGRIVSRTLAEIYASQGAIGEAVETYRILLERVPGMRDDLGPRLRQLEERLRNDPGPRSAPGNAKAPA